MLETGETPKMEVTASTSEIGRGDRMVPAEEDIALPYYQPHAPGQDVNGYIIDIHGAVAEGGPYQVIVVTLGAREGIERGHVLRIQYKPPLEKDIVTDELVEIPPQDTGLAMVFRRITRPPPWCSASSSGSSFSRGASSSPAERSG